MLASMCLFPVMKSVEAKIVQVLPNKSLVNLSSVCMWSKEYMNTRNMFHGKGVFENKQSH